MTSDDATYVIFENCELFLFETEALRALAQGESSKQYLLIMKSTNLAISREFDPSGPSKKGIKVPKQMAIFPNFEKLFLKVYNLTYFSDENHKQNFNVTNTFAGQKHHFWMFSEGYKHYFKILVSKISEI